MSTRIVRNDWSAVTVPDIGDWQPSRPVSVVIPAHDCQASLDLTLAGLARQTYPAHLLEVVVVDDGSQPPLELPKIRPERTRLVRVDDGWGRANALRTGAQHSDGEIIHWLDADMVAYPSHVEAQARWHHQLPYAVTLGYKRFVDAPWPTPDQVADACAAGQAERLFAGHPSQPHDYVERHIARTDQLRDADHLAFLSHVGATAALRREMYEAAGGVDATLRLGEDTELGYRLAQAGAVFIPEPAARSWHLGPSHMMRHQRALQRYNRPFLAARMPLPRWLRASGGAGAVPLVTVVVEAGGQPLERVRVAVDSVLAGDERDVRVLLVGPWDTLDGQRVKVLADPQLDLRLIAETYRHEPRLRLVSEAPDSVFPSPYLLQLPAGCALSRGAVRRLVECADSERLGLVRAGPATLWRTAAVSRARWVGRDGEPFAEVVAQVHGARSLPAGQVGVIDLSGLTTAQLADGVPSVMLPAGRSLPGKVEVAGLRSLLRATWLVARLAAHRARARLRRALGG
jgi:glycosyltransferase involved in cell wall biosynthesis